MKISGALYLVLMFIAVNGFALAQQDKANVNVNDNGVAISGYDVVAYFTLNEAVRGNQKHEADYQGVKYWFASEEHKNMFLKEPGKYVPQYGGYCAFAMGMKNAKVPSDPKTFKLYNGKLYLFFNDYYQGEPFNTIIPWNSDEQNLKKKADANWDKMQK
ncbi:MAG: YHS domain-containing (seleno)protein [Calditrichia bacterium]